MSILMLSYIPSCLWWSWWIIYPIHYFLFLSPMFLADFGISKKSYTYCPIMIKLFFTKHQNDWVDLSKYSAFPQFCGMTVLSVTWPHWLGGSTTFRCNVIYLLSICLKCYHQSDVLIPLKQLAFPPRSRVRLQYLLSITFCHTIYPWDCVNDPT